jgi:hypothetical protein
MNDTAADLVIIFDSCKAKRPNEKKLIRKCSVDPDLHKILKQFYLELKKTESEDVVVLFNWFISNNFMVSINEL